MKSLKLQVPDGQTLRDAEGRSYPGGEPFEAPRTQFWLRRIADGSVVEVKASTGKAKPTAAKK